MYVDTLLQYVPAQGGQFLSLARSLLRLHFRRKQKRLIWVLVPLPSDGYI